mmetsp:Transcript_24895/g.34314  ORF Transcript_24895/g.34314 Transcript_24895/m.34314 type:complete len:246 (+) Transcript_24895:43-780(+)
MNPVTNIKLKTYCKVVNINHDFNQRLFSKSLNRCVRVKSTSSFRIHASSVDPNDPMTWNTSKKDEVAEEEYSVPNKFLTSEEINSMLSTPMGIEPSSKEGETVMKAYQESLEEAPQDAAGAIRFGIQKTSNGDYEGGLEWFQAALGLPGSGVTRDRKKQRELSEGELMSISYNLACCHSRLQNASAGLAALKDAFESGFNNTEDLNTARNDPDLATLREDPAFEVLLAKYKPEGGGLMGFLGNLF